MSPHEQGPDTRSGGNAGAGRGQKSELSQAAERLEKAIEDLVTSASGAVTDKAAGVVDDLERSARRLKAQIGHPDDARFEADADADDAAGTGSGRRSRRRRRARSRWFDEQLGLGDDSDQDYGLGALFGEAPDPDGREAKRGNGWLRDLYREPERGWIAGVCAGLARYYQVDVWVARVVAFSLLLFIPQIAFWAYIIAIFMLGKRPRIDAPVAAPLGRARSGRSPAPELGPRLAPRNGIRSLRVRFRDMELRLRRMEEHVTSREFTLKRELTALESDGDSRGGLA